MNGARICLFFCLAAALAGCRPATQNEVVVYTSQDQEYAEPILAEFTRETGIPVRTVFDNEAVKTVGLVNRLMAERNLPHCDLFWNNEELRSHQLAAEGVYAAAPAWQALGYRSRRLVINTNLVKLAGAPQNFQEVTNAIWQGKVALAYPLFGTTATHFLALRQKWGTVKWEKWCQALSANKPFLVDGNSVVVKLVGRGEAWIGMTDSDDIQAGQREGLPLAGLPISEDSLLIPNTIGIILNAPHPAAAEKLLKYLASEPVVAKLVQARALEGERASSVTTKTIQPDWPDLLKSLPLVTDRLKELFLR